MILEGVSHLHTTYSYDGSLTLREFKDLLIENSINFALITEHSDVIDPVKAEKFIKECHNLSDEKITLIPGFEVPYRDAHVLMIGATHFVKNGTNSAEELKKWRKHSALAVWAHPHRNKYLLYDAIRDVIDGVEVWNSQYDGKKAPRIKVLGSLKGARERGMDLHAFAGLDFHRTEHLGGPSIMVEVPNRQHDIIEALKKGEFDIKAENVTLSSEGDFLKGMVRVIKIQSKISIILIQALKKMSAVVAFLHIPVPKRFRKAIRAKL